MNTVNNIITEIESRSQRNARRFAWTLIASVSGALGVLKLFVYVLPLKYPEYTHEKILSLTFQFSVFLSAAVSWLIWRFYRRVSKSYVNSTVKQIVMEEALRNKEQLVRQITENIDEVFWMTSVEKNRMEYVSSAYEKIWGRPCHELYQDPTSWADAIHPEDRDRVLKAAVEKQVRGDYDEVYRINRPDGFIRWIRDRAYPIKNSKGEVTQVTGIARDITRQVNTDYQLKLWMKALETSATGKIITDIAGKILWVNPALCSMTGYEEEELIGKSVKILKSGQHDKFFYSQMWQTVLSGRVWRGEIINRRKDGRLYPEEMTITPVRAEDREITHFIAVKQDISGRKKDEAEKHDLLLKLFQTEKMASVGQLTSGVAHELNNPLTAVVGLVDLLLEDAKDPEVKADLKTIKEQSVRCSKIVLSLLQFARQHKPQKMPVDVNDILEKSFSLVSYTAKTSSISLHKELDPGLPHIVADPNQLQQVFLNLITNASHAVQESPSPDLTLKTEKVGDKVLIHVSDNGVGIPPESLRKIFDPFYTTKEPGKGTGLGLSICHSIVQEHSGDIQVRSEPGKGTTFTVELPIQKS